MLHFDGDRGGYAGKLELHGPALHPVPSNKFMMRLKELTNFSIWSAVRCGL